jgi:MYXO-CTERM domain-containing protein
MQHSTITRLSVLALCAAATNVAHAKFWNYSLTATGLTGSFGDTSFSNATVSITSNIVSSTFYQEPMPLDGWIDQYTASCSVNFSITSSELTTSFVSSNDWFCYYFVGQGDRIAGFTPDFPSNSLGFGAAELGTAQLNPFAMQLMNETYTPTSSGFFMMNGSQFSFNGGGNFTMNISDAVPAPGAIALLGLAGLAGRRRR